MALYAIGDVHGCLEPLERLLDQLQFDPNQDQLWFVGDLVNKGPDSLGVLRFIRSLGQQAICVLGNHDLHLLYLALAPKARNKPAGLKAILTAHDGPKLIDMVRRWPLLHHDPAQNWVMVHAGLPFHWSLSEALRQAKRLEAIIQSEAALELLRPFRTQLPKVLSNTEQHAKYDLYALTAFTMLRYFDKKQRIDLRFSGHPDERPKRLMPWFKHPEFSLEHPVVFGHWALLGPHQSTQALCLDSGCVYGNSLSAARLDGPSVEIHQVLASA